MPAFSYTHLHGHSPAVLWFTGLSAAGKSTLAQRTRDDLLQQGRFAVLLDGDQVRQGLSSDLGFSPEDRSENIRRVGHLAHLFYTHGAIVLCAFISPYQADRQCTRALFPAQDFIEIYVDCPLEICIQRDPKGLYKRALNGEIEHFTGVSAPYEPPPHPELHIDTARMNCEESTATILQMLQSLL